MRQNEDGFTLVEVLVAFAVLSLVLVGLYEAMAGAYRGQARIKAYEQALDFARTHLETIGIEEPLQIGKTTGRYSDRFGWRLTVEEIDLKAYKAKAFRIVLEPLDQAGQSILTLESFKLVPRKD